MPDATSHVVLVTGSPVRRQDTVGEMAQRTASASWVRRKMATELQPDGIVVLDNAQAHKNVDVIAAVEARGAHVE